MKKNVIALLLSVVLAAGSIGTVPALAAETDVQEKISVESLGEAGRESALASEEDEEAEGDQLAEEASSAETEQAEEEEEIEESVEEASEAETEQTAEEEPEEEMPEETEEADAGLTDEESSEGESAQETEDEPDLEPEESLDEDAIVEEETKDLVDEVGENTVIEKKTIEKAEEMPLMATVLDDDISREGWDYDASTKTLTLTNYGVENVEDFGDGNTQIYSEGDLTLVLEGENTLSAVSDYGIYCDGELVIEGTGSLTIENIATGISAKKGITVSSGRIMVSDSQTGVEARYGDFVFNTGSLTVNNSIEAKNGGDVIIKGGEITADLISTDNDMTIEGGTINGSLNNYSEADGLMTIKGGTIDAEGISAYHFIMTGGDITASGMHMGHMDEISNGTVVCNGNWSITWGDNTVSGGNVTVNGYADWGYYINITGGEITVNGEFQPDSMSMSGGKLTVNNPEGNGIETGPSMDSVSISGGVVDITAGGYGIYVGGYSSSINITGGEVKIASGNGAMTATNGITISEFVKLFAGNDLEHTVETEEYYGEKCIKTIAIQKPIDMLTIIGIIPKTYTGNAIYQEVVVKNSATILKNGTDYTLTYKNNTNVGTASVVITGKGNYTGTVTKSYKIAPKAISTLTISGIIAKTYTGKAQTQAVVVKDGTTTLKNGTHYTLTYMNNTNAGTASVVITGKGNYSGTVTKTFTINKAANAITAGNFTKAYSTKAQSFSLGAKATGGTLTYASNNKSVTVDNAGKVTVKAKFIGNAAITITAQNANYNQAIKRITITVNPNKTALSSAKNSASKKMTVKWKKNAAGSGYQIQYSTAKNFKGAKTVTIKKNKIVTKKIGGLKKGKKYYVRVRTYKAVGKLKFYSGWSKVKKVAIKK